MRSIYIHVPFCRSRCYYCAFTSQCDYTLVQDYIKVLVDNMCYDNTPIDSIYIGGGTPSTLSVAQLTDIMNGVRSHHNILPDAEISIECNPDSLTRDLAQGLVVLGFNRVSMGLQSANNDTLHAIGRRHTYQQLLGAIDCLHDVGINNINVDIMIGLPESQDSFLGTLSAVSQLDITHISMYALELYQDSQLYSNIEQGICAHVPSEDTQTLWYDMGVTILSSMGYRRYEVSNFAKCGNQCRHNVHYWQCDQYYGYGLSAHGYIDGVRYSNTSDLDKYLQGSVVAERIDIDTAESMSEYVMLGLRLDAGVFINAFVDKYRISIFDAFPNISNAISKGYLVIDGNRLYVPSQYSYVLNSILVEIL